MNKTEKPWEQGYLNVISMSAY